MEDEALLAVMVADILEGAGATIVGPAATVRKGSMLAERWAYRHSLARCQFAGRKHRPDCDTCCSLAARQLCLSRAMAEPRRALDRCAGRRQAVYGRRPLVRDPTGAEQRVGSGWRPDLAVTHSRRKLLLSPAERPDLVLMEHPHEAANLLAAEGLAFDLGSSRSFQMLQTFNQDVDAQRPAFTAAAAAMSNAARGWRFRRTERALTAAANLIRSGTVRP